jgi:hypothetical protein
MAGKYEILDIGHITTLTEGDYMAKLGIKIQGQLNSYKALSPSQVKMLEWHLAQNGLEDIASVEVNIYNGTRIEFAHEGPLSRETSAESFVFGEKVARIVEVSKEINLDLSGIIVVHETGMRIGGSAHKLIASSGQVELIWGLIEAGEPEPCFAELGTIVEPRPLPLNFS